MVWLLFVALRKRRGGYLIDKINHIAVRQLLGRNAREDTTFLILDLNTLLQVSVGLRFPFE